jgi:hypothetical protein
MGEDVRPPLLAVGLVELKGEDRVGYKSQALKRKRREERARLSDERREQTYGPGRVLLLDGCKEGALRDERRVRRVEGRTKMITYRKCWLFALETSLRNPREGEKG